MFFLGKKSLKYPLTPTPSKFSGVSTLSGWGDLASLYSGQSRGWQGGLCPLGTLSDMSGGIVRSPEIMARARWVKDLRRV